MSHVVTCYALLWLLVCAASVLPTGATVDDANVPTIASDRAAQVGPASIGRRLLRVSNQPPPVEYEEDFIDHSGGPNSIYGVHQSVGYFQQWVSSSRCHLKWVGVAQYSVGHAHKSMLIRH